MNACQRPRMSAGLWTLLATLTYPGLCTAQQPRAIEFPATPTLPALQELGVIAETRITNGSSRSISMTVENGVRKIRAREDGLQAYIEEHPDGPLLVRVTRQYTSDDLDELMEIEPELYMHLKSIPEQTETAEVEVSVGVTRTFEAPGVAELEQEHPEAFRVYERFTTGSPDDLQRLREVEGLLRMPELPMTPMTLPRRMPMDIQPGDIRIFPQGEEAPGQGEEAPGQGEEAPGQGEAKPAPDPDDQDT